MIHDSFLALISTDICDGILKFWEKVDWICAIKDYERKKLTFFRRVEALKVNGGGGQIWGLGIQSVHGGAGRRHHISYLYLLLQCLPWSSLAQRSIGNESCQWSFTVVPHLLLLVFGFRIRFFSLLHLKSVRICYGLCYVVWLLRKRLKLLEGKKILFFLFCCLWMAKKGIFFWVTRN